MLVNNSIVRNLQIRKVHISRVIYWYEDHMDVTLNSDEDSDGELNVVLDVSAQIEYENDENI